ncbi:MAG: hypothetical protein KatS3mg096_789 [Candidatus Parcubacteria bacterium]|nr:MAG: hypothetical protein KatS3mg096_789 [Candidatus Parcubacteria bacterium]
MKKSNIKKVLFPREFYTDENGIYYNPITDEEIMGMLILLSKVLPKLKEEDGNYVLGEVNDLPTLRGYFERNNEYTVVFKFIQ